MTTLRKVGEATISDERRSTVSA
jgi:hypothetical protein